MRILYFLNLCMQGLALKIRGNLLTLSTIFTVVYKNLSFLNMFLRNQH